MTDFQLFAKVLGFLQQTIAYSNEEMARLDELKGLVRDRLAQPEREWVALTDEEVIDISKATSVYGSDNHYEVLEFVASIEAKLKEKNT